MIVDCGTIIQPPAIYDHIPDRNPLIQILPLDIVIKVCGEHLKKPYGVSYFDACTLKVSFGNYIYRVIIPIEDSHEQQCHWHHELGHVNHWNEDHPDGVYR